MACIVPGIQYVLLRAQTSGDDPAAILDAAIDAWERDATGGDDRGAATARGALRRLLLTSCPPLAALAALARTSGHAAALGMLLAELLARGVVPTGELLTAASPGAGTANLLAAAIVQLHAAATADTLPAPSAKAAAVAFDLLVKLLVTAGHPRSGRSSSTAEQAQQRAAVAALVQLRYEWMSDHSAPQEKPLQLPAGGYGGGASLLAAMVDAADREVFPRESATSWIAGELAHVLQAAPGGSGGSASSQQNDAQGRHPAAADADAERTSWQAAMSAFVAALPLESLLQQVQAAAWGASLAVPRAAALLAAAVTLRPRKRAAVAKWLRQQASAALAQHAACLLRSLLLLQRELVMAAPPETGSSGSGGSRRQGQQGSQGQQLPTEGRAGWHPPELRQGPPGQPTSPEQRYRAWLADTLLSGPAEGAAGTAGAAGPAAGDARNGAQHHLQFLVQQVLVPLCPEDPPAWLTAQRDTLSLLLAQQGEAAQRGVPPLPTGGRQAAEEYVRLAEQRLRALQAQQAQQAEQQGAGAAAGPTNLQKGQAIAQLLIQEWVDGRGQLMEKTIQTMLAKAANVFTRGELHNMLAPALLEPTADVEASEQRAAFMEYLHEELDSRSDTHIKQRFRPDAVQLYRRRCLQAQLEGASLQQLAQLAPQILLAPPAGSRGGGFGGSSGSISRHQLLDRVAALVGEQLAQWSGAQQHPGSAHSAPGGPETLAQVLLGMWTAAYALGGTGSLSPSGAGEEAVGSAAPAAAAHLLSIVHSQPLLHGPFLRLLASVLLGEELCGVEVAASAAQEHGQLTARQQLAAAAMLATTAGALVQPTAAQGKPGSRRHGPQAAGGCLAALQPLFVWRTQQAAGSPAGSGCVSSTGGEPRQVPGPVWLQRLLERLPLGSAAAIRHASAVAAAHLSCLPLFRWYALLPCGSGSEDAGGAGGDSAEHLLLCWRRPVRPSAGPDAYDSDFVCSLVFPACTATLRLQQWLLLRLGMAQTLLQDLMGAEGSPGRATKRQRLEGWPEEHGSAAGADEEAGSLVGAVMQECRSSLQLAQGAQLAAAAGKLPLPVFLRLEAAAAAATSGGASDLLPPGTADTVFRLCCSLYLDPPAAPPEAASLSCVPPVGTRGGALGFADLAWLVEPLTAAGELGERSGAGRAQPGMASGYEVEEEALEVIPDSEDQEAPLPAAAPQAPCSQPAAALAAALGELLVEAGSLLADHGRAGQPPAAATAAVPTCQRAAAHMMRQLAARRGGPILDELLPAVLAAVVQQCRQQLRAQADPAQPSPWAQERGGREPAVRLSYADTGSAVVVRQQVVALACGLVLELLPMPAGSPTGTSMLRKQQARLAAVAAAVQQALDDGPAGGVAHGDSLQQQLEAALDAV